MAHLEDTFDVRARTYDGITDYEVFCAGTNLVMASFKNGKQAYDAAGNMLSALDRMDLSKPRFVYKPLRRHEIEGWAVTDRITGQLISEVIPTRHDARQLAVECDKQWEAWLISCGVPMEYGGESDQAPTVTAQPATWGSW